MRETITQLDKNVARLHGRATKMSEEDWHRTVIAGDETADANWIVAHAVHDATHHLRDTGRARYLAVSDADALRAFRRVTRLEGIIPALETAHALHYAMQAADSEVDVVCCSGRGDKDLAEVLAQA